MLILIKTSNKNIVTNITGKRFMFSLKKAAENLKDKSLTNFLNFPIEKKKVYNFESEFITALNNILKNKEYLNNIAWTLEKTIEKKSIRDFFLTIIKQKENPKYITEQLIKKNCIQNISTSRDKAENIVTIIDELLTLNKYPFQLKRKELIGPEGWNECYYQTGQIHPDFRVLVEPNITKYFDAKINTIKNQNHLIPLKLYINDNKLIYYHYATNLSFKKFLTFKLHALYNLENQTDNLKITEKLKIVEYTNLLKEKNKLELLTLGDFVEVLWATQEIQNIFYCNKIYFNSPIFCIQVEEHETINPEVFKNNTNIDLGEHVKPEYIQHLFSKYKSLIKINEDYFKGNSDMIIQHDVDLVSLIQKIIS